MNKTQLPVQLLPRETKWGIRYLLFQLIFLGSVLALLLQVLRLPTEAIYLDTAYYIVNFGLVIWIFRHFLWQSLKHGIKHWDKLLIAAVVGFAVLFLSTKGLDLLIEKYHPEFFNVNDASIASNSRVHFVLTAIGTVILVPLAEETLYRGLIFGMLQRKNRIIAYTISTLFFAYIHIMGYVGYFPTSMLLLCLVQYLPAGLALAAAYEYSGSILAPILIHTTVNIIATITSR